METFDCNVLTIVISEAELLVFNVKHAAFTNHALEQFARFAVVPQFRGHTHFNRVSGIGGDEAQLAIRFLLAVAVYLGFLSDIGFIQNQTFHSHNRLPLLLRLVVGLNQKRQLLTQVQGKSVPPIWRGFALRIGWHDFLWCCEQQRFHFFIHREVFFVLAVQVITHALVFLFAL